MSENTCLKNSRRILSRHSGVQCVSLVKRRHDLERRTRLLLTPSRSRSKHDLIYQFHLRKWALVKYPYISGERILGLAYVPKLQRLLVSRKPPFHNIASFFLDKRRYTVIIKRFSPQFMSIDDGQQLIFAESKNHSIVSMTTSGKELKFIKHFEIKPRTLTVDEKYKLIYVSLYSYFVSLSYDGEKSKIVTEGKYILAFAPDVTNNHMYFNSDTQVWKFSLNDERKVFVTDVEHAPRLFVLYRDFLFVTFLSRPNVVVVDTKTNMIIHTIKRKYTSSLCSTLICTLP